jgi:hypothetical protein
LPQLDGWRPTMAPHGKAQLPVGRRWRCH